MKLRSADGEGQVTKFIYDNRNRLTGIQRKNDAGSFVNYLTYGLDSEGRKLSVTDAINRITALRYDLAGRLIRVTDAAGKATQFGYDAAGKVEKELDYSRKQ